MKSALAWTAIEELVRRHHRSHEMRAYVTRPGGGMYFCVHLFRGKLDTSAASWNLEGTSFEVKPAFGTARLAHEEAPWRERGFYEYCLTNGVPSALEALEGMVGLPAFRGQHPAPKPHVLGLGLIAEAMRRHAFLAPPLVAEPGFFDSSEEGGGIAEWLGHFPLVLAETKALSEGGRAAWASASRCWILRTNSNPERAVFLDIRTAQILVIRPVAETLDGWRYYRDHGGRLGPVADWVLDRLR